jgi:hypothetical protein
VPVGHQTRPEPTRPHYVSADLDNAAFSALARRTLTVLKPVITQAWVDAFSDRPWPSEVEPALELVIKLSETQGKSARTHLGIDLDLTRPEHFEALIALAPYTIHAEAWAGDEWVWSVNDCGDNLAAALSESESQAVESSALRPSTR